MRSQYKKRKNLKRTRRHRMRGGALKAARLPDMKDTSLFKFVDIFKFVDKVRDFMIANNANAKTTIGDYISILQYAIYYNNPDVVDYVLKNFNLMDANTEAEQHNPAIRHINLLFLSDILFHTVKSNDAANGIDKHSEEYANSRKKIISLLIAKGASVGRLAHFHNEFATHAKNKFEQYQLIEPVIEARKYALTNQVQNSRQIERVSKGLDRSNRFNPLAVQDISNHVYSFMVPPGTAHLDAPAEYDAIKQMRSDFINVHSPIWP